MKIKKYVSVTKQIELLDRRGINFEDMSSSEIEQHISEKSYFELINGFESLFKDKDSETKSFLPGTKFKDFLFLYEFDRELAKEMFKSIDEFENKLKSIISNEFCKHIYSDDTENNKYGIKPDFYLSPTNYENPYTLHNRLKQWGTNRPSTHALKDFNDSVDQVAKSTQKICSRNYLPWLLNNKFIYNYAESKSEVVQYTRLINRLLKRIEENQSIINLFNSKAQSIEDTHNLTSINPDGVKKLQSIADVYRSNNNTPLILNSFLSKDSNFNSSLQPTQEYKKFFSQCIKATEYLIKEIEIVNFCIESNNNLIFRFLNKRLIKKCHSHYLFQHDFFKKTNYIDKIKNAPQYKYTQDYDIPPFWVVIKTLDLGSVIKLLYSLPSNVIDNVVNKLLPNQTNSFREIFFNSLLIIVDLRNSCFHSNLVNRYRTNSRIKINNDLKSKLNLTTNTQGYEIRLRDALKVLGQFVDLDDFYELFRSKILSRGTVLSNRFLNEFLLRMGTRSLRDWY